MTLNECFNFQSEHTPAFGSNSTGNDDFAHERSVWKAVITQALMDASSHSAKVEAKQLKRRARQWLLYDRKDFATVCHYAGMDPNYVREQARQALMRDCRWRAPARRPVEQTSRPVKSVCPAQSLIPSVVSISVAAV